MTADCNGRGTDPPGIPIEREYPDDQSLFLRCAASLVRAVRNRPCVALWCGGNEQTPPLDVDLELRLMLGVPGEAVPFDGHPGGGGYLDATRVYVPGSMWDGFGKGDGAWSDGPYGCQVGLAIITSPCPAHSPAQCNPSNAAASLYFCAADLGRKSLYSSCETKLLFLLDTHS